MISLARFFGGSHYTSSATSFDLDWVKGSWQSVDMTAAGQSVTLPDATTRLLRPGGITFVILNKGANSFTVRDNDGGSLGVLAAGEAMLIGLENQHFAAGEWTTMLMDCA